MNRFSDVAVRRMLEEEDQAIMGEPEPASQPVAPRYEVSLAVESVEASRRRRKGGGPPKKEARCRACSGKGTILAFDVEAMVAERKARGLNRTALAKLAGWTPSMVSMLESGSRPMTAKSAERYWKALQAAGKGGAA